MTAADTSDNEPLLMAVRAVQSARVSHPGTGGRRAPSSAETAQVRAQSPAAAADVWPALTRSAHRGHFWVESSHRSAGKEPFSFKIRNYFIAVASISLSRLDKFFF